MPKDESPEVSRGRVLEQVRRIYYSGTLSPAEEMVATGRVLMEIGEALRKTSSRDARAILRALIELES
jgi:hypothetical protein